jgi:cephalosporin hydroxylase
MIDPDPPSASPSTTPAATPAAPPAARPSRVKRLKRRGYALWRQVYQRPKRLTQTAYHERWAISLRDWLAYHQREIVFDRCHWMGVPTLKNPLDAWIYQEILWETRPDVVVEIGSHSGGSTLFFAHMLDLLGGGQVVSIDIDRSRFQAEHPRIVALTGDCSSPEIVGKVAGLCQDQKVLVIHDGDHSRGAVLRDLELYAGFVNPGGYLIVEDGILDLFPPGDDFGWLVEGPLPAIDDFLAAHPEFEADAARERYVATYNPRGFLRRVG